MSRLYIRYFGGFSAQLDDQVLIFPIAKSKALLAYLAVEAGRPVARDKLSGLLWPDQPQDVAFDNLRQAIFRLHKSLGDSENGLAFLNAGRDHIQLNPQAAIHADLSHFQEALTLADGHIHRHAPVCLICNRQYETAARLFQGEFLEGFSLPDSDLFEDWAATWRLKYHSQALEVFNWLTQYHLRLGNLPKAEQAALRLAELEPLSEAACRSVLEVYARSGKINLVHPFYRTFAARCEVEGGQGPSETLAKFAIQCQTENVVVPGNGTRGLPAPLLPLVGRQAELNELEAWLSDPDRRLITIQGPGGVGKTRLVIEAARRLGRVFEEGVVYTNLSNATGVGDGAALIARAAGLPDTDSRLAQVSSYVHDRDLLLVLDGLELASGCLDLVETILADAPRLVILGISRERLGLEGEWVFPLGGLPFPPEAFVEIERYEAVALFAQHARRADPHFVLDAQNYAAVSQICRLVGGIPLAIGLAAAWVRVLTCAEIAAELQHSMDLLSNEGDLQGRQTVSMRASFDQSWNRLSPQEQRVFRQVSVFQGGFDREAAAAVAEASLVELVALVDQSFLLVSPEGRYELHDLLRQYGAEHLVACGEEEAVRRRHFDYFLNLAGQYETSLRTAKSIQAFLWLVKELANLQSACNWAVACDPRPDPVSIERLKQLVHNDIHKTGVHDLNYLKTRFPK